MSQPPNVIIIGGGIGGLASALFCKKAGLNPTVYESRESQKHEYGGGLQVAPNGIAVLDMLGLATELEENGHVATGMSFRNHKGEELCKLSHQQPSITGYPAVNCKRWTLLRLLEEECERKGVTIKYSKQFERLEDVHTSTPVAVFQDGEQARGDLIIGADGIHSTVRKILFPTKKPEYTGIVGAGGFLDSKHREDIAQAEAEQSLILIFGKKSFFGFSRCAPLSNHHPFMWWSTFPCQKSPDELRNLTEEDIRSMLKELHHDWIPPIPNLVAKGDSLILTRICDIAHLDSWYEGRVILLGDAAHAVSPHSGQGASMALEDAVYLCKLLKDTPSEKWDTVGKRFEEGRKDRCEKIIEAGRKSANQKKELGDFGCWVRDMFVKLFMKKLISSTYGPVFRYRVQWEGDFPANDGGESSRLNYWIPVVVASVAVAVCVFWRPSLLF